MFQVHNNYYPAAKVIYYSEMSKFYGNFFLQHKEKPAKKMTGGDLHYF